EEVRAEVEAVGRRALLVQADVGTASGARHLLAEGIRHFGNLDVLVNNAGVEVNAPFWEVTEEDYDKVLNVNLKGPFFATQARVRDVMGAGRPGKVVNISSVHEELPFPGFAAYCASKGGLRMLTRNLAVELGRFGITVNAIAPGAIETAINKDLLQDSAKRQALLGQIPLGRLGKPEDVAGLAAFLASSGSDDV